MPLGTVDLLLGWPDGEGIDGAERWQLWKTLVERPHLFDAVLHAVRGNLAIVNRGPTGLDGLHDIGQHGEESFAGEDQWRPGKPAVEEGNSLVWRPVQAAGLGGNPPNLSEAVQRSDQVIGGVLKERAYRLGAGRFAEHRHDHV